MKLKPHSTATLIALTLCFADLFVSHAQFNNGIQKRLPPPAVNWTSAEDQKNMMEQLGIKSLRPGPSGDESAPDHANYEESRANQWPVYPDALTFPDGRKVTTPAMWQEQRRPQILEDFDREMYGRVPRDVPKVTWDVKLTDQEFVGRIPVVARHLIGHVDNSAYPLIDVNLDMVLVLPANGPGPVPVLIMFGRAVLPAPSQPTPAEMDQLNQSLREMLAKSDPSVRSILEKYPAYEPMTAIAAPWPSGPYRPPMPTAPPGVNGTSNDLAASEQLIADGWGYAMLDTSSIQADNGAGATRGIVGLVNHGQPRHPDDWGALRAWAWGASRALDYLETVAAVDQEHVGIEGVSRYGKAALVTEAYDQRFFMGLIGSSGEAGVKPSRRLWGEQVENIAGGLHYWMAGNFIKYAADTSSFGPKNPGDLPVDSPELIALCAPRLVFVSYGIPQNGDAKWLDQQGSFMATVAAQPVYELLGARALGVSNNYRSAKMPPVNVGLLDGRLAWRQHDGGHTDAPNVKYFIQWADRFMDRLRTQKQGDR